MTRKIIRPSAARKITRVSDDGIRILYVATQGPRGPQGLKGDDGDPGVPGVSAYQTWLDAGNAGTEAVFLASLKGEPGDPGTNGTNGSDGDSAYQVWLDAGNSGTVQDFLDSLQGEPGDPGADGSGLDPLLTRQVAGLSVTNGADPDHDLTFSSGGVLRLAGVDYAIPDGTFALDAEIGTGNGMADQGYSLPAGGFGYIHLVQNDSTEAYALIANGSATAIAMPGYTRIGYVDSFATNTSSNLIRAKSVATPAGMLHQLYSHIIVLNTAVTATLADYTVCPAGVLCIPHFRLFNIVYGVTSAAATADIIQRIGPSAASGIFDTISYSRAGANDAFVNHLATETGQLAFQIDYAGSGTFTSRVYTIGWLEVFQ